MHVRYLALAAGLAVAPASARSAPAQSSAAEYIRLGDQAHAAMNPAEALPHYVSAIEADSSNYEALWKASRTAADLAEFERDARKRNAWYRDAARYARRAVEVNPNDAEGHFSAARALGLVALTLGVRDRVKYAGEVRRHALEALRLDPNHPGALHVMGRWNAEVMRLSGFERFMAKNFLGGRVFNSASWAEARRYMEKAVEVDPDRLTHHLDLGAIYADIGERDKAREQFEAVINGRAMDYNDQFYKREAERRLQALR